MEFREKPLHRQVLITTVDASELERNPSSSIVNLTAAMHWALWRVRLPGQPVKIYPSLWIRGGIHVCANPIYGV